MDIGSSSVADSPRPLRGAGWPAALVAPLAGVLAVAGVVVNALAALGFRDGWPHFDSGVFATAAQGIVRGQMPFRDFWDIKPPGIHYFDALVLSVLPETQWSLHVGSLLLVLVALAAFYWLARAVAPPHWAAVSTAVFGFYATLPTFAATNLTETLWLVPTALCYGALLRYLRQPTLGRLDPSPTLWLAGLAAGAAVLVKQQAALHLAVAALAVLLAQRSESELSIARLARHLVVLFLASAAVLVPVLLYFAVNGALLDMLDQVVISGFRYAGGSAPARGLPALWDAARWFGREMGTAWLFVAGALGLALWHYVPRWRRARTDREAEPSLRIEAATVALLGAMLVTCVVSIALGGRYFNHYFVMLAPPCMALFAWGLTRIGRRQRLSGWTAAAYVPFVGLLVLGTFLLFTMVATSFAYARATAARLSLQPSAETPRPQAGHEIASPVLRLGPRTLVLSGERDTTVEGDVLRAIMARTAADDYVLLWNVEPRLYFVSGRRPTTRYLRNTGLLSQSAGSEVPRAFFQRELEEHPPSLIVVGLLRNQDQPIPWLAELIRRDYEEVEEPGRNHKFYVQRDVTTARQERTWSTTQIGGAR